MKTGISEKTAEENDISGAGVWGMVWYNKYIGTDTWTPSQFVQSSLLSGTYVGSRGSMRFVNNACRLFSMAARRSICHFIVARY